MGCKDAVSHASDAEAVPLARQLCWESQFCRLQARDDSYYIEERAIVATAARLQWTC